MVMVSLILLKQVLTRLRQQTPTVTVPLTISILIRMATVSLIHLRQVRLRHHLLIQMVMVHKTTWSSTQTMMVLLMLWKLAVIRLIRLT